MAPLAAKLALALAVLAAAVPAALADSAHCKEVPNVPGVDQSPSDPNAYGKCTSAVEGQIWGYSHWCKYGGMGMWPGGPSDKAKQCMKFGRATIYRGPIWGSSPQHKAACKKELHGEDHAALVAVSTKYLKTYQGGWATDKGACDKCMCVRMHGGDNKYNPGLQTEPMQKHMGLTFLAKVGDRCGECEDDHIDLLQDRPLTFAPFKPDGGDNYHAPYANAQDGLRGFSDPNWMRGSQYSLENVGVWTADWQWVPCEWSHEKCGTLMKGMGYQNVFTPKWTEGVDSFSMRPISQLRGTNNDRLFKQPWT
ncbi:hypothetical protein Rsub_09185 [Raphidocelis subcapitata]|uniref:Uncharacterized protein n=1 Tax=Raphidocelis subcapitata TaxID=307507 RepID=A0A2V0P969_9CHLO|nr:hypothetical protein Rsub_09185 [Raphidocelis subcapitata]|eukprot:GBF96386.1 hypothetical protein Rsub_09185 [Raphidocelis subcapitata]